MPLIFSSHPTPPQETSMSFRDYLTALVRTVVPALTGLLIAAATHVGADIDHAALAALVDAAVIAVWYGALRLAESRWPVVGVLLGWKATPSYPEPVKGQDDA